MAVALAVSLFTCWPPAFLAAAAGAFAASLTVSLAGAFSALNAEANNRLADNAMAMTIIGFLCMLSSPV